MIVSEKSVYDYIIYDSDVEAEIAKKIQCGHKHFKALSNEIIFKETDNFEKFIENV